MDMRIKVNPMDMEADLYWEDFQQTSGIYRMVIDDVGRQQMASHRWVVIQAGVSHADHLTLHYSPKEGILEGNSMGYGHATKFRRTREKLCAKVSCDE